MSGLIDDLKKQFNSGTVLIKLIFINVGVFLAVTIVDLIFILFKLPGVLHCNESVSLLTYWFALPAGFSTLLFRPWTLITYMFTHEGIMHLFFNMIVLSFSGRIFLLFLDQKKFVATYLMGGIAGGLFFMFAYTVFPVFANQVDCSFCIGASASVLAILAASAAFVPDYSVNLIFIGSVRLKWIALILFILDIVNIKADNPGGHIAHIGGALWGYVYIQQYKGGRDMSVWVSRILDKVAGIFKKRSKLKVVHNKIRSDAEYNNLKVNKQEKIDLILDKISKSGYESLTKAEKEILFNASRDKH